MLHSLPQIRLSLINHINSSLTLIAYYGTGCGLGKTFGSNLGRDEDVVKYVLSMLILQRDATIYILFIPANCSTHFGWWHQPSSGAHITVFTASGTGRSVWAAIFRYRVWRYPPTISEGSSSDITTSTRCCKYSYMCSDDGWCPHQKHVEQFLAINKLYIVASLCT